MEHSYTEPKVGQEPSSVLFINNAYGVYNMDIDRRSVFFSDSFSRTVIFLTQPLVQG